MKKRNALTLGAALLLSGLSVNGADYTTNTASAKKTTYTLATPYEVVDVPMYHSKKHKKPKNVILLIGDGMGVSQVFAAMTANRGELNLCNFRHIGFSRTPIGRQLYYRLGSRRYGFELWKTN